MPSTRLWARLFPHGSSRGRTSVAIIVVLGGLSGAVAGLFQSLTPSAPIHWALPKTYRKPTTTRPGYDPAGPFRPRDAHAPGPTFY